MVLKTSDLKAVLTLLKEYDNADGKTTSKRLAESFSEFYELFARLCTNLSNEKRVELALNAATAAVQLGANEVKSFFDAAASFVVKDGELEENSRTGLWQRKQLSANIAKTKCETNGVNSQVLKNMIEAKSVALSVDDNLLINRLNVRSNVFSATAVANNLNAISNQASAIYKDIEAIKSHEVYAGYETKHNEILNKIELTAPEEVSK